MTQVGPDRGLSRTLERRESLSVVGIFYIINSKSFESLDLPKKDPHGGQSQ
jgi:hypothetical protein